MSSYISSTNIIAYPSGRRSVPVSTSPSGDAYNMDGTLFTESRLASIVNNLLDIDGFVTIPRPNENIESSTNSLEFNILGRYFKILNPYTSLDLGSVSQSAIYFGAKISHGNPETNEIFYEVDGQDDGTPSVYKGIVVETDDTGFSETEYNTYTDSNGFTYIKAAVKIDGVWYVPEPNYSKVCFMDAGEIDAPAQSE